MSMLESPLITQVCDGSVHHKKGGYGKMLSLVIMLPPHTSKLSSMLHAITVILIKTASYLTEVHVYISAVLAY